MKIAYLVSCYPAVSHTFIQREIGQLRRQGFRVETASINETNISRPTEIELEEIHRTFYVKRKGFIKAIWAIIKMVVTHPVRLLSAKFYGFRLAGWNLKKQFKMLAYLMEAALIGQWMKRQRCHHLHVHFANAASTVALLVSKLFSIPFSITVHGPDVFYEVSDLYLQEKVEKARFVIAISSYARSQLCRLVPLEMWEKVRVCHLGVDPKVYAPVSKEFDDVFEILCVGRLVPAKGQHILLMAMKILLEEKRKVRLRLVGEGPDRASLQRQAGILGLGDSVIFEGAKNPEEVKRLYSQADAFVLPSFAEGLPVVLMEAMACGLPCVTTNITGVPEAIRNGVEGQLVFAGSDHLLSEAIAELMDNPDMRRRMSKAGRQRIEEKFDLEKNSRKLAEIFASWVS